MFLKSSESLSYDRSETAPSFFMRFLHTSGCDVSLAVEAPAARQLDYKYQQFFKPSNGKESNVNKCSNHLFSASIGSKLLAPSLASFVKKGACCEDVSSLDVRYFAMCHGFEESG